VLGPVADEIGERLQAERDWPGRFAVLDRELTRVLVAGPAGGVSAEVGHSWRRLLTARGGCGVAELAAETGWSDRHLRARWRAARRRSGWPRSSETSKLWPATTCQPCWHER
jgi:hypothetical protein